LIVIPLAGESSRFKNEGIFEPKWSLIVGGKTILEKSIESVLPSMREFENILFIVNTESESTLRSIMVRYEFLNIHVSTLDHSTMGQADSVLRGLKDGDYDLEDRLVIWCGDSAFEPTALNFRSRSGNWLATSMLEGDHWSFVELVNGEVRQVTEKLRISNHASIGLYGFNSAREFMELNLTQVLDDYKEMYVAPLYNQLIKLNRRVDIIEIDCMKFLPFGTPRELLETSKKHGWITE